MTALQVIEEVYEFTLNPNLPYFVQLEPLAASGELANKIHTNKVLFKLCELVDLQAKKIKSLEDDRVEIAKRITELGKADNKTTRTNIVNTDPTRPLA